jgi:nicotinamide riboside transporter PnuC
MLHWSIMVLSLVGCWLNIRKHWSGFAIWAVTNAAWMMIDLAAGLYAQAALFFVYLLLAIYGLVAWRK